MNTHALLNTIHNMVVDESCKFNKKTLNLGIRDDRTLSYWIMQQDTGLDADFVPKFFVARESVNTTRVITICRRKRLFRKPEYLVLVLV
jgi:hypothetical protein